MRSTTKKQTAFNAAIDSAYVHIDRRLSSRHARDAERAALEGIRAAIMAYHIEIDRAQRPHLYRSQ